MSGPTEVVAGGVPADLDAALAEVAALLTGATDVTLFAHVNPDADALGSALALGVALRRAGATVRVSFGEPAETPPTLRALDSEGLIVSPADVPQAPPLLVVCDTGALQRLGGLADRVAATKAAGGPVVVIDHHVLNTRFGTHHVVDESAEATVMLVLRLLDHLGVELDEVLARCLYAGLVTDTSCFRRAAPETHRVAARLLEAGVEPRTLTRQLIDTHPFSWIGMLAEVLRDVRLEPEAAQGRGFVHAVVRLAHYDGLAHEELDSVIDVVRTAGEADVAAVFKEIGHDRWSVSLRSDGAVDVGQAARTCGGGGHQLASGFTADGAADAVIARLRDALTQAPTLR